jgi:virulence-associated protein VagC
MKKSKDDPGTARLVRHGAYQYVLLPKGFEFDGDTVKISWQGRGVLLETLKRATVPKAKGSSR